MCSVTFAADQHPGRNDCTEAQYVYGGIPPFQPMRRRRMLAVVSATVATFAAGCIDTPTDDPDDDDMNEDATPRLEQVRLDPADCESPESASVSFEQADERVIVHGCVTGETACHYPEVESAGYEDGVFRLVVFTDFQADEDEACAQVLTDRGYKVEATFDGGVPREVEVVHDDTHGRATVATASR